MNLAGTTLRLARQGDAPTLAAMSRDLIESGLGWHYRTERIGQLLGDAGTVSLVACEDARTAGFAIMTLGEERAHLVLLAVRADHHRRGIGRRLTQWLVETAVTAGIARSMSNCARRTRRRTCSTARSASSKRFASPATIAGAKRRSA